MLIQIRFLVLDVEFIKKSLKYLNLRFWIYFILRLQMDLHKSNLELSLT